MLSWDWPDAYASKTLLASGALGQPFQAVPVTLLHPTSGHFEAVLPNTPAPAQFYRLSLSLK